MPTEEKLKILSLRVSEALPKDVGRGLIRCDPKDMKALGVEIGDIVQVLGKKKTVAKVMPTYPESRGKSLVQMDGIVRGNAEAGLDEKVQIEKVDYKPAQAIVLVPLGVTKTQRNERDARYLGRLLEGLPLITGDTVRATLFGSRFQDFKVSETHPQAPVVISSATQIKMEEEGAFKERKIKVSYEDIGGLSKEIQKIREMIELPLRYPEVFDRLGIDPPKGVLLYGPPGCGKTLIARAVAQETEATFIPLSGPEIMHKFYGESEAHLRKIFQNATENAPSIIFLDEIDAIAPKREELGGEKQVERRVVAQLLSLMDGLTSRGEVIVIAATNIPQSLDPALRRPGRFDREITIGIPDKKGRLSILEIHTRGMPLAEDVSLPKLAEITHGFVGADLEALCREAAMTTLRKIFPKVDFQSEEIPYEALMDLEVTMDSFQQALAEIEPSALREVFTEIPDVKWEDVGGLAEIKRTLVEAVQWPLKYPELFQYTLTKPPKGILLYGNPGTGKTLLAKAVAFESGVNFISVKGPELLSKWVGESERGVREVFKKAKQASPCIIFLDEIDSLIPVREKGGGETATTDRVVSQFLTELDGIEELKGVLVLAATNRLDRIDPALLRSGRFDLLFEIPPPDEKARLEILKIHTQGKPLGKDVHLENLARVSPNLVGSDLESLCRTASMLAIREYISRGKDVDAHPNFKITSRHFEGALEIIKTQKKSTEKS